MKLINGINALILSLDPFQLKFSRAGRTLLCSAPDPQPATLTETETALHVNFPTSSLSISSHEEGFRLQAVGEFSIAFELDGYWFGQGELLHQRLPLNRLMQPLSPLETFDNGPAGQSCKLTPAWFSSTGALIQAHSPVLVGMNQPPADYPRHSWSMGSDKGPFSQRPFADNNNQGDGLLTLQGKDLHLSITLSDNAVTAFQAMVLAYGHPSQTPPDELFTKPTWTTWARYKTNINQDLILTYANEIIAHSFPYGVLEIDDRWQTFYGDLNFDPDRFPDAKGMVSELHQKGFKVTAWVIPFLEPKSSAFATGHEQGYLVRQQNGEPYLVPWWQGQGGLLDVTNSAALAWFLERLHMLQEQTGLDGFKFDAGEACFVPPDAITAEPVHPNHYTQRYVDFVSQYFSLTEVRSGWLNQKAPIFFRQWDKSTTWGADNGLHSVLTGILALGLTGYPFILPDMIGGNAYENQANAELMIRWTQVNALLPAMQFSLAPWDYGKECAKFCRRYAELHQEFAPQILKLAKEITQTGKPIIRPIWWSDPHDELALICDDEFLLGDDTLVAPVLLPGARSRNIYLPRGSWQDYWNGSVFHGNQVLKDYPAPLDHLPIMKRQE
jgi:myogenesis-regulating glycosidase